MVLIDIEIVVQINRCSRLIVCFALMVVLTFWACDNVGDSLDQPQLLSDVVELAVGSVHSCALRKDGSVVCWGYNGFGQLGFRPSQGDFEMIDPVGITPKKVQGYSRYASVVKGLQDVQHLAAGANHTCAILSGGEVKCWGDSSSGQLGNGDYSPDDCEGRPCSYAPVLVHGLDRVVELALGDVHSCAIDVAGDVSCWGSIAVGISAESLDSCDGNPCTTTPVKVPLEQKAVQLIAGSRHTCALLSDGKVMCWGENRFGQVGAYPQGRQPNPEFDSSLLYVYHPVQVDLSGNSAARIDVGGTAFAFLDKSCAQLVDGSLYCWGKNEWGQLGIGEIGTESCWISPTRQTPCSTRPKKVMIEAEVEQYELRDTTGCAVTVDKELYCWGKANFTQLGSEVELEERCENASPCALKPTLVETLIPVKDVALAFRYSCVLQEDGFIRCWGWESNSDSGDSGSGIDCSSSKNPCLLEPSWDGIPEKMLITHFDTLCVVSEGGEVHCMGDFKAKSRTIETEPLKVNP